MSSFSYKVTTPKYQDSLGSEVHSRRTLMSLGRRVIFWEAIGSVNREWSATEKSGGLCCRINEILFNGRNRLYPPRSKVSANSPPYNVGCFMVGPDQDHATPHVAIICDDSYFGNKARKVILEHGVLRQVGWGRACLHFPTGVFPLMEGDDDILHTMPGHYTPRDAEADFRILCASLNLPVSPMGVGIIAQSQAFSNTSTLGGLLKVDDAMYGLSVAHIFEKGQCHNITAEGESSHDASSDKESTFELFELDIYEVAAPETSGASEGLDFQSQNIGLEQLTAEVSDLSTNEHLRDIGYPHYRQTDNACSPDYALLTLDPETSWISNSVITTKSADTWRFHYPSQIAQSMPQEDAVVLIPSRYGILEGKSIESVSILCMGQPESAYLVWKIRLDDIQQGQCGSWVLDEEGDQVLGILVAACPALSEAYILPMKDIIADIIAREVGKEVNLPQDPISILHKAVMIGNAESIETALSQNLDRDVMFHADSGYSKIYQAAETGNLAVVKQLIKEGADLDKKRSILTVSPVFEASRLQQNLAFQRLLDVGFNPNLGVTMKEYAPLCVCIIQGHTDIAVALIEAGAAIAAIYTVRSLTPLMAAIARGSNNQPGPSEVKSASDMEKEYPNEGIRLAIKRSEEAAKMLKEEEQQTKDDGKGGGAPGDAEAKSEDRSAE
ncbi:hypothetical protein BJX99DRAFT_208325 [Aspergillus californicus]